MIRLHQFYPVWTLTTASSFCLKLETYLRMAGHPYEVVVELDPRKAPLGKLPYIEDGGETLVDSGLIVEYLKSKYGDSLDTGLSAEQRAVALALRRMAEESLYWSLMYSRWIDDAGWRHHEPAYFGMMPAPLRWIVPKIVRASVKKELDGHGRGRLPKEAVYTLGREDLDALADFLGEKPFFFGETPTSLDAAVYGVLAHIHYPPFSTPLKEHMAAKPNLVAFVERIRERYYA